MCEGGVMLEGEGGPAVHQVGAVSGFPVLAFLEGRGGQW